MAPGGPGGWPARPARLRAATNVGSMTTGPDLQAGFDTLPMVWPRQRPGAQGITDTLIEVTHARFAGADRDFLLTYRQLSVRLAPDKTWEGWLNAATLAHVPNVEFAGRVSVTGDKEADQVSPQQGRSTVRAGRRSSWEPLAVGWLPTLLTIPRTSPHDPARACDRANIVNQHIPSAFWPTVPRLVLWSAFNAGMARTGVGLVTKLATTTGWDELQTVLGLDNYEATEAGALSLTAATVTSTRTGDPLGCHSRPLLPRLPTTSFFLVSTLITVGADQVDLQRGPTPVRRAARPARW